MADHFSVPTHTTFFAGYLDAVGRQFTDGEGLCALPVVLMPSAIIDGLNILATTPVENMGREFERDIADFLGTDTRRRLVFYLIEYFDWYKEFSDTCVCEKLQLKGKNELSRHCLSALY